MMWRKQLDFVSADDTLKTALNVSLRQSPFLNVLSDSEIAKTLQLMTRQASTRLTPELTRELCLRAGSKAYLAGSISSLGSEYVLGLKAVNGDRSALKFLESRSRLSQGCLRERARRGPHSERQSEVRAENISGCRSVV